MRKQFVIGSRIQERDKKNAEYYVGDYLPHSMNGDFADPVSWLSRLIAARGAVRGFSRVGPNKVKGLLVFLFT